MNEDMLFMTEDQVEEYESFQQDDAVASKNYLIFLTDDLKFGIDAENVETIITDYVITKLPMLPEFIRGIINLRGQMIPLVDIRLRLGKFPKEDYLVIVLNIHDAQIGILVDAVDQMINIPDADILPMPAQSVQQLVSGMCSLPDGSGTMMVLDCGQLMPND